jgi:hypothetical protein
MTVNVSASYVLVAHISSLYFRTHTNLALQPEVPEERDHDDDDNDDDNNDDDDVDTASASLTPSPSVSTSSTVSKKKKHDTSDLRATLTKFVASRDKSDRQGMTKRKQLTVFFKTLPRQW